jgi:hypothetical protein
MYANKDGKGDGIGIKKSPAVEIKGEFQHYNLHDNNKIQESPANKISKIINPQSKLDYGMSVEDPQQDNHLKKDNEDDYH